MNEPYYTVNQTQEQRRQDGSFQLRHSHNRAKLILLTQRGNGLHLLDFGCGKGGDLRKWEALKYKEVHAIDIDNHGLRELRKRYRGMKTPSVVTLCADMTNDMQSFIKRNSFDVVSAMYSMHYACETRKTLETFISNVSYALKPGGFFVGITLDAKKLADEEVLSFFTQDNQQFAKFRQTPNSSTVEVTIRSISEHPRTEYLVNFDEFEECMFFNSMRFATPEEISKLGLSVSVGSLLSLAPTSNLSSDERRYTDMYKYWVATKF